MANLTPVPGWKDVPQIERTTRVLGGPGAEANWQAQALLDRTEFLKAEQDSQREDLVGPLGATVIGDADPLSAEEFNASLGNRQFRTTKVWGVPSLITSYATNKLQRMLDNERQVIITEGVYKLDAPLMINYGGEPGMPQTISGLGNVELYQVDSSLECFRLNGKSDIEIARISKMGHRISPAQSISSGGKAIADRDASNTILKSDRVSILENGFYQVGTQAIINWGGGEDWLVKGNRSRQTGREFFFSLNGKRNLLIANVIDYSGDDGIAFAQASDYCSAIANVISNPGRWNLGGSGIRTNGRGTIIKGNQIFNPSVFGIVVAETSDEVSRPDDVEVEGNYIYGLTPFGTNLVFVAGIAINNALRVKLRGGLINLAGSANAYPAIRVYGTKQTTALSVSGLTARNTRELIYLQNAGVSRLNIDNSEAVATTHFLAMQDSGSYQEIELRNNVDIDRGAGSVFRLNGAASPIIASVTVSGHKSKNPTASQTAISVSNKTIDKVVLEKNEWAGGTAMASINNVADLYTDGDQSGKRVNQGLGTIATGATSVTITHGIKDVFGTDTQPSPYFLEVGSLSNPVAYRVSTPTSTSFTVAISAAQTSDTTFRWKIAPRLLHYVSGSVAA